MRCYFSVSFISNFILCSGLSHSTLIQCVSAKDFGVHGHTFEIAEPDLLQEITTKLYQLEAQGVIERHNEELIQQAKKSSSSLPAVKGITKAGDSRVFYYDPTIVVPYDLKDHKGHIFHKAGTRINPFHYRSLSSELIFIQGEDEEQIRWAEQHHLQANQKSKVILVSGSPFALMEKWQKPVFFDQGGYITRKLGIKAVPAIVSQEGLRLKISEISLGHNDTSIKENSLALDRDETSLDESDTAFEQKEDQ